MFEILRFTNGHTGRTRNRTDVFPVIADLNADGDTLASGAFADTGNGYETAMAVPGLSRRDIRMELRGRKLYISGEKSWARKRDRLRGYAARGAAHYRLTLTLPADADPGTLKAKCRDGMLTVTIEKAAHLKRRRIDVRRAGETAAPNALQKAWGRVKGWFRRLAGRLRGMQTAN